MNHGRYLFLFPGETGGWLRIADDGVESRGEAIEAIPPLDEDAGSEKVVLVLPGTDVAVHWVDLPGNLSPAQATGGARILAGEICAEPLDTVHVALGDKTEREEGRCMAFVSTAVMERELAAVQALGFDPDHIVAESLLVAPPAEGVRLFRRAEVDNVRGKRRALAAEADLAAILLAEEAVETIDTDTFERNLASALAAMPVDLRQGDFAKRRRWKADAGRIRRMAMLAGAILLATLTIQATLIVRYSFAADAVERETMELARDALPGNTEITDPHGQLRQRLARLGGGPGYSSLASAIFAAIRQTEATELQSLVYASTSGAQLTVAAEDQAALDAVQRHLEAAGFAVTPGTVRDSGRRRIADFGVRAR